MIVVDHWVADLEFSQRADNCVGIPVLDRTSAPLKDLFAVKLCFGNQLDAGPGKVHAMFQLGDVDRQRHRVIDKFLPVTDTPRCQPVRSEQAEQGLTTPGRFCREQNPVTCPGEMIDKRAKGVLGMRVDLKISRPGAIKLDCPVGVFQVERKQLDMPHAGNLAIQLVGGQEQMCWRQRRPFPVDPARSHNVPVSRPPGGPRFRVRPPRVPAVWPH